MWFTVSSQLELFVADPVGTLGFWGGGQQHSPTPVILSPHHPTEQRCLSSSEVCAQGGHSPSLWCSGLGRFCPVVSATQAGLSEGAARASQLIEVTAAFPPSLLFRACSALLWLVHREPVWSVTSQSSRRPCSDPFCCFPGRACVGSSFHPSPAASASQLMLSLPRNNLPFRFGGGAGGDFTVVHQILFPKCLVFIPFKRQPVHGLNLVGELLSSLEMQRRWQKWNFSSMIIPK